MISVLFAVVCTEPIFIGSTVVEVKYLILIFDHTILSRIPAENCLAVLVHPFAYEIQVHESTDLIFFLILT
jgi:uncharacterized membrane protein YozB (DUF420 family)